MKNLYVGNLPHSTTESELRTVFEAHGAVDKISIVTDRETGRSRGFAFVAARHRAGGLETGFQCSPLIPFGSGPVRHRVKT
jgi:hypothetical protein